MGKNAGSFGWGQENGPEQDDHLPPPRKPKRRLSLKAWLVIAGAVVVFAIIGSLLPDRVHPSPTAFPTTVPAPVAATPTTPPVAQDQPTLPPAQGTVASEAPKTPTPAPTPTMDAREASNDWWFDQGGNQINSTIRVLNRFAAAARSGDRADAQSECSQLQAYASVWSPQSLLTLPDPDPAVGEDLVQAFKEGRTGTQVAADKCARYFEKNDQGALSESVQFATAGSSELDKVQTGLLSLQGLTPPAGPKAAEVPQMPSDITDGPKIECVGARFRYESLVGISCDEAKSILQTVLETGGPLGARSQVTADFECYESNYIEQTEGQSDMTCWARKDEGQRDYIVLEANYR